MVIKSYGGRIFVEGDFYKIIERVITGLSKNKVWIYTVEKILEKYRDSDEYSDKPIIRVVRWRAINDVTSKKKIWRYNGSYNIRSADQWSSASEAVELLIDEEIEDSGFVLISKEEHKKLHSKLLQKEDKIAGLGSQIRKLKDVESSTVAELAAFKKRYSLMRSNIKKYEGELKDFNKLISDKKTTETKIHKFIIDKSVYWLFGLEYVDIKSKVKFPPGKNFYEFDLMIKRHDGFWDLVELKGPNENLFDKRTKRRNKPNQKLSEAISQAITYLNVCDQVGNKEIFKPKAYAVIGKDKTDKPKERRLFESYLNNIDLITYSELYKRGKKLLEYIKKTSVS
jgi:hypothetical protein